MIDTLCSSCGREINWPEDWSHAPLCFGCGLTPQEQRRDYFRDYREANKADIAAKKRDYYEANKVKFKTDPDSICEVMDCWAPVVNKATGLCQRHQQRFEQLLSQRQAVAS